MTVVITKVEKLGEKERVGLATPQSVLVVTPRQVHSSWTLPTHPYGNRQEIRNRDMGMEWMSHL